MSEAAFWKSTLAKVTALFNVQVLDWQRKRDYFPAELCAITMNKRRTKESDKVWTADDFLEMRYPKLRKSVMITAHDPDHGALGGNELKAHLRATTESIKRRRTKRKVKT